MAIYYDVTCLYVQSQCLICSFCSHFKDLENLASMSGTDPSPEPHVPLSKSHVSLLVFVWIGCIDILKIIGAGTAESHVALVNPIGRRESPGLGP